MFPEGDLEVIMVKSKDLGVRTRNVRGKSRIIRNRRDRTGRKGSTRHVNIIRGGEVRTWKMKIAISSRVHDPTIFVATTILLMTRNKFSMALIAITVLMDLPLPRRPMYASLLMLVLALSPTALHHN